MIVDALLAADPTLGISATIEDPDRYLHTTDAILHDIAASRDPALQKSRDILRAMRSRDLYKFVDEVLVPQEILGHFRKEHATAERIIEFRGTDEGHVDAGDIIVQWLKINYAMKDKNPVDHIRFYSRFNDDSASGAESGGNER